MRRIAAVVGMVLVAVGLTACSPEQRPAGYLDVVPGLTLGPLEQEVTGASVTLPHLAYDLAYVEVTDIVEQGTARRLALGQEPFASATGEEFVLARLDQEAPERTGTGDVTATLRVPGVQYDLTAEMTARNAQDQVLILVSVPVGGDVQLELTEGSQTATFDLRAGELSEDGTST